MKDEEVRNGTSSKITGDGHYVEKEFIDNEGWDKKKTYYPEINMDNKGLRYIITNVQEIKI